MVRCIALAERALKGVTVLTLEQALTLPYTTYKLALEGATVIRLENPLMPDPNRFVGKNVLGEEGMNTYFLPYNVGKKSITLNLAEGEGRELLKKIIVKLNVDVFATNQLPHRYKKLGIDYETLKEVKEDIIWVGVTGFGPDIVEAAYDPILQARAGVMDLTGEPDGPPMIPGIPIADLAAGEHTYSEILKALYKRAVTGKGSRIDVSMFHSTVSWLITKLPHHKSFGQKIVRTGNRHPFFTPVDVFPTKDGYVYIAIGNDRQWEDFTQLPPFKELREDRYATNEGRRADADNLIRRISQITVNLGSQELLNMLSEARIPSTKINTLEDVCNDPLVSDRMLKSKDLKTGVEIYLPPPSTMEAQKELTKLPLGFPPRLGEHNEEIYCEKLGLSKEELKRLKEKKII